MSSVTNGSVAGGRDGAVAPGSGVECSAPTRVAVDSLVVGWRVRSAGVDVAHVRALAEVAGSLPPIVVHRPTMSVVDGLHRLRAAQHRGDVEIDVVFFDGTPAEAFVLAVTANTTHGLPLALADRKAAAARLIAEHGTWSDRRISTIAGLSHKTVGALRKCASGESTHSHTHRVGQDGRQWPLDTSVSRLEARRMLEDRPSASLREVAKATGLSPSTVREVRKRLEDPPPVPVDAMIALLSDPVVRSGEIKRLLLLLDLHMRSMRRRQPMIEHTPRHLVELVSSAARECAEVWDGVAERLERHGGDTDRRIPVRPAPGRA